MNCEYCKTRLFQDDRSCPTCGAPIFAAGARVAIRGSVLKNQTLRFNKKIHQVKIGDSWARLAEDFYGDQRMFKTLKDDNPGVVLVAGQTHVFLLRGKI